MTILDTLTPMLPLSIAVGGYSTSDPALTPGGYALPVGAVTVTREYVQTDDTTLNGFGIVLAGSGKVRSITIRIEIDDQHPAPARLGQAWASLEPGSMVSVSETHSNRHGDTVYSPCQIRTNTIKAARQASLTRAYYVGAIECRLLVQE